MRSEIAYIKNEALDLPIDSTKSVLCCFCDDDEGKLSITRLQEGLLYNCFRAKCSGKGFIGSLPSDLLEKRKKNRFTPKPFDKPTNQIDGDWLTWLCQKYRLRATTIAEQGWKLLATGTRGLVMPLFNGHGYQYGHTTKHWQAGKKAIHYLTTETCMNHYAQPLRGGSVAVLVEDVISAAKVNQIGYVQGVALLGTTLNEAKVKDLLKWGYNNVIIALDPDAVTTALKMKKEFGLFFRTCKVVMLPDDPKDMDNDELEKALGEDDT
jgi:hypothetical protein